MAKLAKVLAALAGNGTQVFVATHSLYMLRELSLLLATPPFSDVDRKFFALSAGQNGSEVKEGKRAEDIEPISALDAELEQSDRYLQAANQDGLA
jgi:wobble nucleotide-excising tRNase